MKNSIVSICISTLIFCQLLVFVSTEKNIDFLRQRSEKDKILYLTDTEFKDNVEKGPRDFNVILFFTSIDSTKCPYCGVIEDQMKTISDWYSNKIGAGERSIFFVAVDLTKNEKIIRQYKESIKALPLLTRLPPTKKTGNQLKWATNDAIQFSALKFDPSAENLAIYFSALIGDSKLSPPVPSIWPRVLTVGAGLLALLLFLIRYGKNKYLWFGLSMVVIMAVYGGSVWNINHYPYLQWTMKSGSRTIVIYPGRDQQTISEAIIVSTVTVTCGLVFVMFTEWVPKHTSRIKRFGAFLLVLLSFSSLYLLLVWIFFIKTPWYFRWTQ